MHMHIRNTHAHSRIFTIAIGTPPYSGTPSYSATPPYSLAVAQAIKPKLDPSDAHKIKYVNVHAIA